MANHKIQCWCGMNLNPRRLHYPANNPENGPAHRPSSPCPICGIAPHSGPCFPNCQCLNPNPITYTGDLPDQTITLCRSCGDEIPTLTEYLAQIEPITHGPLGLASEHINLHMLRSNGHSSMGSHLALAISKFLTEETTNA